MARYTYLAADLLTNSIYGELPLHGVRFDRILNDAGSFQGSANLDNDILDNDDLLAGTTPGRTALYIYRNDAIVWGGIIWSRTYQSQAKSLQLYGQTFESYAERRRYKPSAVVRYSTGQCALLNTLWQVLQSDEYSNIGVLPATLPSSDVNKTLTINPWELKTFHDYIKEILELDTGPDYTIECSESSGSPQKRLRVGVNLGAQPSSTNLMIDYPGNILNYYYSESAAKGCNTSWAVGDGDNSATKIGYAESATSLANGYPRLENVVNHDGVTSQSTINAHATTDLADAPLPTVTRTFEVKPDEEPELGSYSLGDYARIHIVDTRFPDGRDETARVMGWSVTPSSSDSTEEMSLILEGEGE